MKALGNEIAKNLALAGVGSLTIVDDEILLEEDLGAQFLVSEQHLGMMVSRVLSFHHHTSFLTFFSGLKQPSHKSGS